jgi:Flp pilus assembly protein TadG
MLRRLRKSGRSGVAAFELTLLLPVLVAIFLGLADFSLAYHQELQVDATLASAAEFAFTDGQTNTGSTLTSDITNFIGVISPGLTASAVYNDNDTTVGDCYCVTGSPPSYTLASSCGAACSDGSTSGKYVSITVSFTYTPLFAADKLFFSGPISQTVTQRLQ